MYGANIPFKSLPLLMHRPNSAGVTTTSVAGVTMIAHETSLHTSIIKNIT